MIGDAIKIEEYVPITIPNVRTNAKSYNSTAPPMMRAIIEISVVNEVLIVRPNVWLIDILIKVGVETFTLEFEFSLILSKITIVSLIEYPKSVKSAAMIGTLGLI